MLFKSSFQILAALLWKSSQLVGLWLGVKKFFKSVWRVFVSQLVQSFWLLLSLWHLDSWWVCWLYHLHYQLIYTNLFEFRKWLVYKDSVLRDTKLPSKLPWPSRKQSTIFISSSSNLVFLTFSILSANTEPLVCVVFVLWKELNKCFLYFFLKSLFFAMLGILSTPLFLWLKSTARSTLSNTCPLFAITFPLNRYLNSVYRQSTCW